MIGQIRSVADSVSGEAIRQGSYTTPDASPMAIQQSFFWNPPNVEDGEKLHRLRAVLNNFVLRCPLPIMSLSSHEN